MKDEVLKDVEAHRRLRVICEISYCLQVPEENKTEQIERGNGHLPHIHDDSTESCKEHFNMKSSLEWVVVGQRAKANQDPRGGIEAVESCGQKHDTEPP